MAMRAKEVYKTVKGLGSLTAGQVTLVDCDWENASHVALQVSPHGGLYKGGSFVFRIELPDSFPMKPPTVTCETPIYHPNIDFSFREESVHDNVCVSLLDEWRGVNQGLDDVVQALLFLFYHPNLEDPLTAYISPGMDETEFADNVRHSLLGEAVEGLTFAAITTHSADGETLAEACPDTVTLNQLNACNSEDVLLSLERMVHDLEVAVCDDTHEGYLDLFGFVAKYEYLVAEQFDGPDMWEDYSDYIQFTQEEQLKQLLGADEYKNETEPVESSSDSLPIDSEPYDSALGHDSVFSNDSILSHLTKRPARNTKFNTLNCTFVGQNFEYGLNFVSTAIYSLVSDLFKSD